MWLCQREEKDNAKAIHLLAVNTPANNKGPSRLVSNTF